LKISKLDLISQNPDLGLQEQYPLSLKTSLLNNSY